VLAVPRIDVSRDNDGEIGQGAVNRVRAELREAGHVLLLRGVPAIGQRRADRPAVRSGLALAPVVDFPGQPRGTEPVQNRPLPSGRRGLERPPKWVAPGIQGVIRDAAWYPLFCSGRGDPWRGLIAIAAPARPGALRHRNVPEETVLAGQDRVQVTS